MILLPEETAHPVKAFFDSFNAIILKLIDMIMSVAPYGVFALLAALVVEAPSLELFQALALYAITLLLGLAAMILVYALIVKLFTGRNPTRFSKELHLPNCWPFLPVLVRQHCLLPYGVRRRKFRGR